ncbi:hypothetical protein CDIK_2712 [Cucumispora dikerogammari]|nr:hypothetical protein CDIK_2712 [Cucumispora dikerogammari]
MNINQRKLKQTNFLIKTFISSHPEMNKYFSTYKIFVNLPHDRSSKITETMNFYIEFISLKTQIFNFDNLHPSFINKIDPLTLENVTLLYLILIYQTRKLNRVYKIDFKEVDICVVLTLIRHLKFSSIALIFGKLLIVFYESNKNQLNLIKNCIINYLADIIECLEDNKTPEYTTFLNLIIYSFHIYDIFFIDYVVKQMIILLRNPVNELKDLFIKIISFYKNQLVNFKKLLKKIEVIYRTTSVTGKLLIVNSIMNSFNWKRVNQMTVNYLLFDLLIKLIKFAFTENMDIITRYFVEEIINISATIIDSPVLSKLFIEGLFAEVYSSCKRKSQLEKVPCLKILRAMVKIDSAIFRERLSAFNERK